MEIGPALIVHQGSWWTFGGLFGGVLVSTKKMKVVLHGQVDLHLYGA